MRKILTRDQYLDTLRTQNYSKFTGIPKSNEAFANDVNWGDSWVGRLINSIKRKAKVAINLRRVDSLAKRLRSLFDELLEIGKIVVDSSTISFLTTLTYFDELADKINNKEDVQVIISHIDIMISQIKSYNLVDGEKLIDKLNEFKDFLKGLESEKESKENVESEEKLVSNVDDYFKNLELLKEVLKLVQGPSSPAPVTPSSETGGEVGKGAGFKEDELKNPNMVVYKNKEGQIKPNIISKDQSKIVSGNINLETPKFENNWAGLKKNILNVVPPVKMGSKISFIKNGQKIIGTIVSISDKNDTIKVKSEDGKEHSFVMRNTDFKKVESFIFEDTTPNPDDKSKKVLEKLKGAANILTSSKDKGLAIDIKWIDQILSLRNDEKVQELATGLYKTIYAYLLGDKKQTLNPNTSGLMEGFVDDYKLDTKYGYGVGKTQIAAEKMARFYYFCLKFTSDKPLELSNGDIGAYKLIGNIGSKLKELNDSTTEILKKEFNEKEEKKEVEFKVGDVVKYKRDNGEEAENEIIKVEGDKIFFKDKEGKEFSKTFGEIISKVDKKNESVIRKYNQFKKIFEATEGVDYDSISDKFNEVFDDDTKETFKITEETKERLEKIVTAGDSIVITNSDPIMEIVRLFNRAWRLHTPGRIPSGRGGGKVSMSVFQEYENLGDGGGSPDDPGNGPYRNIELYEKWQEAVLSILGDTKYRTTIFSDDAKFVFVSGEELKQAVSLTSITKGENKVDVAKSKPLGKILLRFINNLLADTQMYKKGGAMPKFMEEYFGIKGEDVDNLSYGGFQDVKNNIKTSEGIVTPKVKFESFSVSGGAGDLKTSLKEGALSSGDIFRLQFKEKATKYFRIVSDDQNNNCFVEVFNSFPLERVQISGIRLQMPTDVRVASINVRKPVRINDVLNLKQCKFNVIKDKFVTGFEVLSVEIKKFEILKTEEGDSFSETDKYLSPIILKKIRESDLKKLKNEVKH
jgi:hypothetical protein